MALWIRLLGFVIFGIAGMAVVLFFGRKQFKKWEKIFTVALALVLVLLGGGSTLGALIAPDVQTVVGVYDGATRSHGLSFFEMEYCFLVGEEKMYLELDAFSANALLKDDFEEGKTYTVSYETKSNLIVAVR